MLFDVRIAISVTLGLFYFGQYELLSYIIREGLNSRRENENNRDN